MLGRDESFSDGREIIWKTAGSKSDVTHSKESIEKNSVAVVVVSCSRTKVSDCLNSIMEAEGFDTLPFDYYISHGCESKAISDLAKTYEKFTYLKFSRGNKYRIGYQGISWHYQQFLTKIFDQLEYQKVIIIEDDLRICKCFNHISS
ncbi:hypothetical protein RF11_11059 [Thelohanellus kitauei]|uniref:Alpha-1,3-mannosyl-glycoprotein 2-beta-N-acetylglucosaminyltransferase n=1 Tax=Thelohanellus kitauei TaxID=669202 RepID=A0A0C2MZ41_THEKT|nr:hypothetical protein RF11_11059 [Thelohanellus kitauei]